MLGFILHYVVYSAGPHAGTRCRVDTEIPARRFTAKIPRLSPTLSLLVQNY